MNRILKDHTKPV